MENYMFPENSSILCFQNYILWIYNILIYEYAYIINIYIKWYIIDIKLK